MCIRCQYNELQKVISFNYKVTLQRGNNCTFLVGICWTWPPMGLKLPGVIYISSVVLCQDMKIYKKIGAG